MVSTAKDRMVASPASAGTATTRRRLGPLDVLVLSAWCGLAAGLLEVGARVLGRSLDPPNRLYAMSRHFVWLAPLSNLLLFSAVGLVLALAARPWPRWWGWLGPRLIGFWAILPVLMVASARIYPQAWVILALGIASYLASLLERHAIGLRRRLVWSFPGLLAMVLVLAGLLFGRDRLQEWREAGRPRPPADAPNVLLIVLDTVRADRLGAYGYGRPTSPTLERLARRGIRFEQARAPAPWTLPSHASFFTGRWPHELGLKGLAPLGGDFPTLAEYLGSRGYATAGFVANTLLCSYETGLDRGFTHYEDYVLAQLSPFRTAWLVDHGLKALRGLGLFVSRNLDLGPFRPLLESWLEPLLMMDRKKDAASINRAFLDWLSRRREPGRPFFAFLNYYDAHEPYVLPRGAAYRFGLKPQSQADFVFLLEHWATADKLKLPQRYQALARDCYDNCLAYLDEQLGELCDELGRRGVLERTLVIIVGDHGEGLGEHDLFDHGESLYSTEIRVPLLIVPPARHPSHQVVAGPVSLRDLPATIADLTGLGAGSPFPGRSLAGLGRDPPHGSDSGVLGGALSELPSPNPSDPNRGRSPAHRGPLIALAEGEFVYIRNQGDGTEELFNEREDPYELVNRARLDALQPILRRFRDRLARMTAAPTPAAR